MDSSKLIVCGGRSNPDLVTKVCGHLDTDPTEINYVDFSNGNIKVTIQRNVRNHDVFVFASGAHGGIDNRFYSLSKEERERALDAMRLGLENLDATTRLFATSLLATMATFSDISSYLCNRDFVELLIMIHALKSSSARRITVALTYYFYVRSDKKEEGRISVTAKLVAKLLECAGADRVLLMDLHAPQIRDYFDIPADQIFADPLFFQWIRRNGLYDFVVITADEGNSKPTRRIARWLGDVRVGTIEKERTDDRENPTVHQVVGADVKGKICLLFDDEGLTFNTACGDLDILVKYGAVAIYGFVTHFICSNGGGQKIDNSALTNLITTNTVPYQGELPTKVIVQDVSLLFALAIRRIHEERSLSELINDLRERALSGKPLVG